MLTLEEIVLFLHILQDLKLFQNRRLRDMYDCRIKKEILKALGGIVPSTLSPFILPASSSCSLSSTYIGLLP